MRKPAQLLIYHYFTIFLAYDIQKNFFSTYQYSICTFTIRFDILEINSLFNFTIYTGDCRKCVVHLS